MRGGNWSGAASERPPWVASTLAAILIFTIVVDVLGNLLVILSVCRNKKLRNAGIARTPSGSPKAAWKIHKHLEHWELSCTLNKTI